MDAVMQKQTRSKVCDINILKLIQERCPDGVPFYRLDQVFDIVGGYSPSMDHPEYWTDGTVPFFRMENIPRCGCVLNNTDTQMFCTMDSVRGKPFPGMSLIVATCATIGVHALVCQDFLANQRFSVLVPATVHGPKIAGHEVLKIANELLDMRFANYYAFELDKWCRDNTNQGTFKTVNMTGFRAFLWPVPPLAVQQEIVNILDKLTELERELERELELRKKQYQWALNELMTFGDGAEYRSLGSLGVFKRGHGIDKSLLYSDGEFPVIHYGQIYTTYQVQTDHTVSFVSNDVAAVSVRANHGDVIVCLTETADLGFVGKAVANVSGVDIAISNDAGVLHLNHDVVDSVYLSYYMYSHIFQKRKERCKYGTSIIHLDTDRWQQIPIPIPPIAVQHEIVSILDKLHAYMYDLESGLAGEIALRRKQYEYCRDLVLDFRRKQS